MTDHITLPRAVVEQVWEVLNITIDKQNATRWSGPPYANGDIYIDLRILHESEYALREALAEPVQEPVAYIHRQGNHWEVSERPLAHDEKARGWTEEPLFTAPPQHQAEPVQEPDAYGYASRLATSIWQKHYKNVSPEWKPLDDLLGVLSQIDNMTAGLTRQRAVTRPPRLNAQSKPSAQGERNDQR